MPSLRQADQPRPEAQLTPLDEVRQRIETSLKRSAETVFAVMALISVLGISLVLALKLLDVPHPELQKLRLMAAAVAGLSSLIALFISHHKGMRWAVAWFAGSVYLIATTLSLYLGTGVASSANAVPVAMVVVLGFILGPRAGLVATAVACAGTLGMLALESSGLISGMHAGNQPPASTYALVQVLVFSMVGITIARYSHLFWEALSALERARVELLAKVKIQSDTQHALLESEQQLNTLLDQAPLAVLIFAPKTGQLHYANHHALQAHGAADAQALEALHLFSQDAPFRQENLRQAIAEVRATGSCELRWKTRHANGQDIWWAVKLHDLPVQGATHMAAYAQDITTQLAAEKALLQYQEQLEAQVRDRTAEVMRQRRRLEGVIDALPVTLNIKDRLGRHQLSNRLFELSTGKTKYELIGKSLTDLYSPDVASKIQQQDDALFGGAPMIRHEDSHWLADGTQVDLLVTKVPLLDSHGQPESVLTLGVDISDIKALQRDLAAAKTEAEHLTRVMSEFLANMSHEIRTPLHGVLGLAHVGQTRYAADNGARQTFEKITQSGRHLLDIIDTILDFSKIDAGKLHINECPLDPRQVASDALSVIETRAREKGIALKMQIDDAIPTVTGDPLRIRQILINLLSNAVKFTERGSVTMSAHAQDHALIFAIQDTGIGMHSDAQARVFSPFEQADGSTTRRFGGTGLGLSISQQLARLMGGEILLHSVLGEGSTFNLILPLKATRQLPTCPTAPEHPPQHASQPQLAGLRVLAVDDVSVNGDIIKNLLEHEQAEVCIAESGKEALTHLRCQAPGWFDIVLMDVQMPVMNGMQATELLHMVDPGLPVVAVTAHALPEEFQQCAEAGMIGHIAKPFEPQLLIQVILEHARPRAGTPATLANAGIATPPPALDTHDIDLPGALRRCGGKAPLLLKLLTRFSADQADFADRCQTLLTTNPEDARHLAHMFRGTSANLGLVTLSRHARDLEEAITIRDTLAINAAIEALRPVVQPHMDLLLGQLQKETTHA